MLFALRQVIRTPDCCVLAVADVDVKLHLSALDGRTADGAGAAAAIEDEVLLVFLGVT